MSDRNAPHLPVELALLGLLALLWGSSYLFIKIAVQTVPPVTLIAARVSIVKSLAITTPSAGFFASNSDPC